MKLNLKSRLLLFAAATGFVFAVSFYRDSFSNRTSPHVFGSRKSGVVFHDRWRSASLYMAVSEDLLKPTCRVIDSRGKIVFDYKQGDCHFFQNGSIALFKHNGEIEFFDKNAKKLWSKQVYAKYDFAVSADEKEIFVFSYPPGNEPNHLLILGYSDQGNEIFRWDVFAHPKEVQKIPSRYGDGLPFLKRYLHQSSIQLLPPNSLEKTHPVFKKGNVLIYSFIDQAMFIIDRETSKIVWTYLVLDTARREIPGDPISAKQFWRGVHKATFTSKGEIIFSAYLSRPTQEVHRDSRFVPWSWNSLSRLNPVNFQSTWQYHADPIGTSFTTSEESAEVLENGHIFVTRPTNGSSFELTPEGRVVWEWYNPERVNTDLTAPLHRVKPVVLTSPASVARLAQSIK
jgi:hypothetical protein